ncbi:MAG: hypothetical protein AAGB97_00815 [Dehalococcoidia bacterium]
MLSLASSSERPAAIYAAMLLAVFGALFAALCALSVRLQLLFATPWLVLERAGLLPEWIILYWIWVVLFPVMGFAAGVLVLTRPKVAGALMFISALCGFIGSLILARPFDESPLISLPGCLLLVLAGAFALTSARKQSKERASP